MLDSPQNLSRSRVALLGAALAAAASTGCYSGQVLVERARADALRSRVEEFSLGRYEVTMPREAGPLGMTEVQIEPFGTTARYKLEDTRTHIAENEYRIRHAVLMTVRSAELEDFADPDLTRLRERLLAAVQEALGDKEIYSVGFREVRFIRH